MFHTSRAIIVEGKYDQIRLASLTDALILSTDGFGIFTDREKQLGGTTFKTATFIENEKFGGRYIVQFSPDAPVKGKDVTVNNVCAVFFAESDASLPAIEQLISTLQVDLAG